MISPASGEGVVSMTIKQCDLSAPLSASEKSTLAQFYKDHPPQDLKSISDYVPDPRDWIMGDGLLERKQVTVMTSMTSSGKSTFAAQLILSLLTGSPLLGRIQVRGKQKVLYMEAEDSYTTLKKDFTSMVEHDPLGKQAMKEKRLQTHWYAASVDTFFKDLVPVMKDVKPDVLVINPISSYSGGISLVAADEMDLWRDMMHPILHTFNTALLLMSHTKKPLKPGTVARKDDCIGPTMIYQLFGATTLAQWARAGIELSEIAPGSNKARRFVMNFSKAIERSGLKDESGRELSHLIVEHSTDLKKPVWSISTESSGAETTSREQFIIWEAKRCGGVVPHFETLSELAKTSKVMKDKKEGTSPSALQRVADKMMADGLLSHVEGGRYYLVKKDKKSGGQSSESARTGAGHIARIKTAPLQKPRGKK